MSDTRRCLARLTSWEKTKGVIGISNRTASHVHVCKGIPVSGPLCEWCKKRPVDGKYQSKMLHGLLTDPIPDVSHIYGGRWYWAQVEGKKGGDPAEAWVVAAQEAQAAAEEWCGAGAWTVQRPEALALKEMVRKKNEDVTKRRAQTAAAAASPKGTLLTSFPVIESYYQEVPDAPLAGRGFDATMWKETRDGVEVWVWENGMVFTVAATGKPGRRIS